MKAGLLNDLIDRAMLKLNNKLDQEEELRNFLKELQDNTKILLEEDGAMHATLYLCAVNSLEEKFGEDFLALSKWMRQIMILAFIYEISINFKTSVEKRNFIKENFDNFDEMFSVSKKMDLGRTPQTFTTH